MSELSGTELVDWRVLPPGQRRAWWEQLWDGAVALADRYRLGLRRGWWEDQIQVEALAAFSCWLELYDSGANTDPTGKVQLLWELERLRGVLRAGEHAFHPGRDREAFDRYVAAVVGEAGERVARVGGVGEDAVEQAGWPPVLG